MIDSLGNLSAIGSALAHALFDGLWVGAIVVLAVHIILHAFRGMNAATRHAAWYAALVIIAAMPVISFGASLAQLRFTTSSATAMTVELPSGPAALTVVAQAAPAFDTFATAPPATTSAENTATCSALRWFSKSKLDACRKPLAIAKTSKLNFGVIATPMKTAIG